MCWRDDIRMIRFCSFCHQEYYGDLGHRNCPVFTKEKESVPTSTTNKNSEQNRLVDINPNEYISCDYGDDD